MKHLLASAAIAGALMLGSCGTTPNGTSTFLGLTVLQVQQGIAVTCGVVTDAAPIAALLNTAVPGIQTAEQLFVFLCQGFQAVPVNSARYRGPYGAAAVFVVVRTPNGPITITGHR